MGRLIERSDVYNAIQIASDKFGIAKQPVESAMRSMLSQIPSVSAIRIPENATNGDMIMAMFPNMHMDNECNGVFYGYKPGNTATPMMGVDFNWWNAPYRETEGDK